MNKDLSTGLILTVVVSVIGIGLLYLGVSGSLPTGFGLFNMDNLGTRAAVFIVLVIIVVVLGFVYFKGQGSSSTKES